VERIPAIVMGKGGAGNNVKYYGIPSGYEFVTITEDLIALSQPKSPLSADTRKKLNLVDQDVHIQVFVTTT